jgi:hypothetical protein
VFGCINTNGRYIKAFVAVLFKQIYGACAGKGIHTGFGEYIFAFPSMAAGHDRNFASSDGG